MSRSISSVVKILLFYILIFGFSSCIVVKEQVDEEQDFEQSAILSPKPEIPLSDIILRSNKGDMVSFIPKDWFFIDTEERSSADVLAVVCNPEYSLCAIFTAVNIPALKINSEEKKINVDILFDVARECFARRAQKSAGAVKLIGKYQNLQIGNKDFVKYEFSTTNGAIVAKSAVFASSIGQFYEFTLLPMTILGNEIPTQKEFNKIFNSFLAAIQY